MADDKDTKALAKRDEVPSARRMFDVLIALQEVAVAELAKGPGVASLAWRKLHDMIAELLGDEPMEKPSPVVGRQPVVMPPGYKHPIPAKGGAQPIRPDQGVQPPPGVIGETPPLPAEPAGDIRKRADVAAELDRVKRGGKGGGK